MAIELESPHGEYAGVLNAEANVWNLRTAAGPHADANGTDRNLLIQMADLLLNELQVPFGKSHKIRGSAK